MKKILAIFMVLVLTLTFVACTFDDEPIKVSGDNGEENEKVDEKLGLNGSAEFKNLKFTASEIKESTGSTYFTPEEGKVFVGIKFTIENVSNEEQSVSSMLLFEAYADDVKCDYSVNASLAFDEGTLDGTIAPGKKLVGWYSLELPQDWSAIEVLVKADWLSDNSATFVFNK